MSTINVELHTSSELEVGAKFEAEIKVINSLDGEEESRGVVINGKVGRRMRPLGYVNRIPQYTNIISDQLIEAMDANGLDRVEVEVCEKVEKKDDGRSIYLLSVNNLDVSSYLLGMNASLKNILNPFIEDENNTSSKQNTSNEVIVSQSKKAIEKAFDEKGLIRRALDELSGRSSNKNLNTSESDKENVSEAFTTEIKRLSVGGAGKENPNKMKVVNLIKQGENPVLSLKKGKDENIYVIFDGKLAGEVEIKDKDDMIMVSDIVSVSADGFKPFGYYINVEVKNSISEAQNTVSTSENKGDEKESLFVEIMKPILSEIIGENGEIALTAEDVDISKPLVNEVWRIVNRVKGEEVSEEEVLENENLDTKEACKPTKKSIEKPNTVEEKKSKKVDMEEIKKIMSYLSINKVPEKYINKIIKSYKEYPERYLERIPSSKDAGFTPWKWDGKGESKLKQAIALIERGKNLRLVGGKGAGKNTLLNTLSWVYQRPLFSQSANRDTDITHLFGDKTIDAVDIDGQVAQTVEFEKGLLVEAMEVGGFYEFGEGNACRAEVTMALHSVLDSRREADVNGYKLVKAHEDFSFVLTMNADYEGCNSLNQAFRDRFVTVAFPSPNSIMQVLKQACPTARNRDIQICDRLYSHILSRVDELQTDDIVTIRGYINALDLAEDLDLKTALQMCVAYNVSDDELIVQEILEIIDSVVA